MARDAADEIQRLQIEETAKALCEGGDAGRSPRRRRATLLQHLALAVRHIVDGQAHLSTQEVLVATLDRHGHDTQDARTIFATLKHTQALHYEDYDRILKELGDPPREEASLELLKRSKPDTFLGRKTYEPF